MAKSVLSKFTVDWAIFRKENWDIIYRVTLEEPLT